MTHTAYSVTTTPVQVFSGTGRVRIQAITGTSYIAGSNNAINSTGMVMVASEVYDFSFETPSEIWVASNSTSAIRVLEWY